MKSKKNQYEIQNKFNEAIQHITRRNPNILGITILTFEYFSEFGPKKGREPGSKVSNFSNYAISIYSVSCKQEAMMIATIRNIMINDEKYEKPGDGGSASKVPPPHLSRPRELPDPST